MIVEAKTVTVYVHTLPAPTRRRRAFTKAAAYQNAAWTKIRSRCECVMPEIDTGAPGASCRFHDPEFHSDGGSHESPPEFRAPRVWGLPGPSFFWTSYGKAVAFRLARFYRHIDSVRAATSSRDGETHGS